jgi:hypothetical protein
MATWRNRGISNARFLLFALFLFGGRASAQAKNSCLDCHRSLDPPLQVTEQQFTSDIHAQKGFTCASCYGGDPTKADMDAMSKAAGFRGKIDRKKVPELCGRCHSDAAFMRQYNPSLRTDQWNQYKTSVHGKLFTKGDKRWRCASIATAFTDCGPPATPARKFTRSTSPKLAPAATLMLRT